MNIGQAFYLMQTDLFLCNKLFVRGINSVRSGAQIRAGHEYLDSIFEMFDQMRSCLFMVDRSDDGNVGMFLSGLENTL